MSLDNLCYIELIEKFVLYPVLVFCYHIVQGPKGFRQYLNLDFTLVLVYNLMPANRWFKDRDELA